MARSPRAWCCPVRHPQVQKSIDARVEPLADLITIVPTSGDVSGGVPPKNLSDTDVAMLQKAPDVVAVTPVVTGPSTIETQLSQATQLPE